MHTDWKRYSLIVFGGSFALILVGILVFWRTNNPPTNNPDTPPGDAQQEVGFNIDDYKNATANLETSKGDIIIQLFPQEAPKTAESFIRLSESGYYDGLTFHRVEPGFVIQTGDPTGTGSGGESFWQAPFADEINANSLGLDQVLVKDTDYLKNSYEESVLTEYAYKTVKELYEQVDGYQYRTDLLSAQMSVGAVAMANQGPDTNGSQFFIVTTEPQLHLEGKHTVFGQVISGLDVANSITTEDTISAVTITK